MKRTELKRSGSRGEGGFLSAFLKISQDAIYKPPHLKVMLAVLLALAIPIVAHANQYTAYSLKVAQQRIKGASKNWRQKEPEIVSLAGINKVEGFVFDSANGELILVGQKEQGRAALTLDDLVVALRARFRHNEWPLVSIDPIPDTEKTQKQHVRFEGGIKDTAFGQAMFDADYRLKEMGIGLQSPGIVGLKTYWDHNVEQLETGSLVGECNINSRFWFYPISPHVTVREGVCVVRGLRVGVFTEVMAAKIDGKQVENVKGFKDAAGDAFARDVSEQFESLCKTQPSFNRLRGLQELVAVTKALEDLKERSDLSYWLQNYPVVKEHTEEEVKVLRRKHDGKRGSYKLSGGVRLTALAMRLNAGDVTALRSAVLKMRPSDSLSWSFVAAQWVIPLTPGQIKSEDVAPLFTQALFLHEQERHSDAIILYDEILELNPHFSEAWSNKGLVLHDLRRTQEAIACYERALEINPLFAYAWYNKGNVLGELGRNSEALKCLDHALRINQHYAEAWCNKGVVLSNLGRTQEAFVCFDHALEIDPRATVAWYNKGVELHKLGQIQDALQCFDHALEINQRFAEAWCNKGVTLGSLGRFAEEIECLNRALEINPRYSEAWFNKGVTLYEHGRRQDALACFDHALEIDPCDINTYCKKGVVLGELGQIQEALICFEHALEIDPRDVGAWCNKGVALVASGRIEEAIQSFDRALEINPRYAEAWYYKGLVLGELSRTDEALKCYNHALEINPRHAKAWYDKGVTLYKLGRTQEALASFECALEINPRYVEAWYNKGVVLYNLKRYSECHQAYDKAAELGFQQAQQALELLELERH